MGLQANRCECCFHVQSFFYNRLCVCRMKLRKSVGIQVRMSRLLLSASTPSIVQSCIYIDANMFALRGVLVAF